MRNRDQSYRFVETSGDYVVEVSGGHRSRRFEISRAAVVMAALAVGLVATATVGAAGYLIFRDDLLAGLIDRQTQMQYAYEDRIAAMRLRLDQLASRQFIDQDGVEGKVQSLVLRQAQLETRAAVVAQLVERTISRDGGVTMISPAARAETLAPAVNRAAPVARAAGAALPATGPAAAAKAPKSALDENAVGGSGKPEPEGLDLRLGRELEGKPLPLAPPEAAPNRGELTPIDTSLAPRAVAPTTSLAHAADPDAPMTARLESLAMSLDRIERDQARRLSGIVRPALEAATRLRRAFDIAGLPVERYVARARRKDAPGAVGGPFVAADPRMPGGLFERDLAAAQSAVATLDGLRRALPTTPLRKPLAGELQMTSTFGYRTDPFFGRPALHSGVDLRDEYGTPVRATAAGVVSVAGPQGGYGNMVEIDHGGGLSTRYAHLSAISVAPGQQVPPGGLVGRVGSTGRSTGPHLHYEVRMDGEAVDPSRFLRAASALGGVLQ
ncbi:M23 family metallopeptidase [Methylocystis sp. ATCC 49242]|uniref:M23 family metallopeptidase n=1 Tax=Methylocystis sp. ATCC 49242 TaxID=622637 RepID=UPI0001F879D1|nr:M23 family metallopeptidase [Methylocystis sp. ATCC 49242]